MLRTTGTLLATLAMLPAAVGADVTAVAIFPPKVTIRGTDEAPQLAVTGKTGTREIDVSAEAAYSVSDPKVCRVDGDGRVFPLANGTATVTAKFGSKSATTTVTVTGTESPRSINFANQIEPILTKLGCNAGGCHGKIQGQNGFRLSLLGFDPQLDHLTLTRESRGRRLLPSAPDASLFLTKATGQVPHGGGKKTEVGSEEYKVLRRWIASGMPYGATTDPTVVRVTVFPEARVLNRQTRQQLVVHAHYSDGSVEDVTRRAQYESNETDVATVGESGIVRTLSLTGQSGVMVRFSGQMTVFRATVPRPGTPPAFDFPVATFIDTHTAAKWRELGIAPSPVAADDVFLRRAYLDITGTLPSPEVVRAFLADTDAKKRDKLIDRLVETPEYAYYFTNKWADILRVKRRNQPNRAAGTFAFHNWIRDAIHEDMPFDRFARAILTATGDEATSPPSVWYREVATPEQFVDDVSQVFLGQRLTCANCHHHPYEKWSQDDYWGLAAFYGRVGRKELTIPGKSNNNNDNRRLVVYVRSNGGVTNKRTNKTAVPTPPAGEAVPVEADDDPRQQLADWMTDAKNPFFARAITNRYWAHFFGRGIVDPLDDMRVTNPPSNPELLDALAVEFVKNQFSLKALVKAICKSRTYQLSAVPTETNAGDKQSFARYYPKRLSAEVVFDAVGRVTDSPSQFPGLPTDRNAPQRALMLPDESFASYFLDVFGRPQRISACECERVNEASLAMTLHLLNSQEVQEKIARGGGRADQLAKDTRSDDEKVTELFLWATGKPPTVDQLKLAREHLAKQSANKRVGYENVVWALVNTKAFLFNQ